MNEYALHFESFRAAASGGDLCRGDKCSGWHLSEVDTWHRCHGDDCGGVENTTHPEVWAEIEEGETAPPAPLAPTLPAPPNDDEIPF